MKSLFNNNGKKNHIDIKSILKNTPYFKDLTKNELRLLARLIYVRWYQKDEIILQKFSEKFLSTETEKQKRLEEANDILSFFGDHNIPDNFTKLLPR